MLPPTTASPAPPSPLLFRCYCFPSSSKCPHHNAIDYKSRLGKHCTVPRAVAKHNFNWKHFFFRGKVTCKQDVATPTRACCFDQKILTPEWFMGGNYTTVFCCNFMGGENTRAWVPLRHVEYSVRNFHDWLQGSNSATEIHSVKWKSIQFCRNRPETIAFVCRQAPVQVGPLFSRIWTITNSRLIQNNSEIALLSLRC